MEYDKRHGGPYDRGSADCYYRRDFDPHYWTKGTGSGERITLERGTPEYAAYVAGWDYQVACGDFKEWD